MTCDFSSYRLRDGLGYQVSLLARVMERDFERRLARLEITRLMWCVLPTVGLEGLERPSEIAEHIGVNRTALSRVLKQLEDREFITREPDDADGRSTRVRLTASGRSCLKAALPQSLGTTQHFGTKLSDSELTTFRSLIDKLLSGEEGALPGI